MALALAVPQNGSAISALSPDARRPFSNPWPARKEPLVGQKAVDVFYLGATISVGAPARFLVLPGVEFLQVAKPSCPRARQQHTVGPIR